MAGEGCARAYPSLEDLILHEGHMAHRRKGRKGMSRKGRGKTAIMSTMDAPFGGRGKKRGRGRKSR